MGLDGATGRALPMAKGGTRTSYLGTFPVEEVSTFGGSKEPSEALQEVITQLMNLAEHNPTGHKTEFLYLCLLPLLCPWRLRDSMGEKDNKDMKKNVMNTQRSHPRPLSEFRCSSLRQNKLVIERSFKLDDRLH